jgi:hypothetical protein
MAGAAVQWLMQANRWLWIGGAGAGAAFPRKIYNASNHRLLPRRPR